jgi:hypothetical protein
MIANEVEFKVISVDELHRACVLDEHGREILITPEMIEKACVSLVDNFRVPRYSAIN